MTCTKHLPHPPTMRLHFQGILQNKAMPRSSTCKPTQKGLEAGASSKVIWAGRGAMNSQLPNADTADQFQTVQSCHDTNAARRLSPTCMAPAVKLESI